MPFKELGFPDEESRMRALEIIEELEEEGPIEVETVQLGRHDSVVVPTWFFTKLQPKLLEENLQFTAVDIQQKSRFSAG